MLASIIFEKYLGTSLVPWLGHFGKGQALNYTPWLV